jgi:large subunit ribosomal protein L17
MRHRISGRTFGRRSGPRKALLRGLISNLIQSERITTTVAKAKELRMHVEPLITLAKRGDLHSRRLVAAQVYTKENVQKLFDDLAVRFKDRKGGYTRIFKANQRLGDGAPMAMIEFLDRKAEKAEGKKAAPKKKAETKKASAKSEAADDKPAKASSKPAAKKTATKKATKSK